MSSIFEKIGQKVSFKEGTALFKQGDVPAGVFLIKKGYVFLYSGDPSPDSFLADIGPGELLGETSVIFGEPHSMTALCCSDMEGFYVEKKDFVEIARNETPLTRFTIHSMSKRLRRASKQMTRFRKYLVGFDPDRATLVFEAGSRQTAEVMIDHVRINNLPYEVGSTKMGDLKANANDHGLFLRMPEAASFEINHCAITKGKNEILVVDKGTVSGTIVNGVRIGHQGASMRHPLRLGDNYIVLGKPNSSARLVLTYMP